MAGTSWHDGAPCEASNASNVGWDMQPIMDGNDLGIDVCVYDIPHGFNDKSWANFEKKKPYSRDRDSQATLVLPLWEIRPL